MPKFPIPSLTLILTLLIPTYAYFGPLHAWIDHIFDFHLELDRVKEGRKQEGYEKDGVWYEHRAFYEAERERDSQKGTNDNTPDRDR